MQVSELDRAEFPHSYVRKRRMTCGNRMICSGNAPIVRNFRTIDGGIPAPYTAECARYAADWFSIVDCMAVDLTLNSRTMFLAFIYIMPLLVNDRVEATLI